LRFALETRHGAGPAGEFAARLESLIVEAGGEVVDNHQEPDMLVSVGGDGTMLGAVRRALVWDVPVLGFNLGTLGFLAQAEPGEARAVVERILAGDYWVEERMTISATVGNATAVGVNDVVVEKVDTTRLVSLEVTIDDEPFITYRADGLIVATPTGSTAYSFSAGGPLVDPRLQALVITPVAAHSLFDRALVFPASSVIRLRVSRDRPVRANVDKASLGEIAEGQVVEIRQGERPARFVALRTGGFPALIKDKFELNR
jgi:NAD+ kinase